MHWQNTLGILLMTQYQYGNGRILPGFCQVHSWNLKQGLYRLLVFYFDWPMKRNGLIEETNVSDTVMSNAYVLLSKAHVAKWICKFKWCYMIRFHILFNLWRMSTFDACQFIAYSSARTCIHQFSRVNCDRQHEGYVSHELNSTSIYMLCFDTHLPALIDSLEYHWFSFCSFGFILWKMYTTGNWISRGATVYIIYTKFSCQNKEPLL